jgi:hypothetical protein
MFGASSAATSKTGGMFGMLSMLASMPWLQFNPLSLMNANKGVFGVSLGHMWDEVDRVSDWVDQLRGLWDKDAITSKIVGHSVPMKPPRPIISFRTARTSGKRC